MDAHLRRTRWAALAFLVVQTFLYRPAPHLEMPFSLWPVALLLGAGMLAAQALSLKARAASDQAFRTAGVLQTLLDLLVILACCQLWSFDGRSEVWVLLVLVIFEAALRGGRRWALVTGAGAVAGYAAVAVAALDLPFSDIVPGLLTFRLGLLAFIILILAVLSDHYTRHVTQLHEARRDQVDRAARLRRIAEAGRGFAGMELEAVVSGIADTLITLGFDTAALCRIDRDRYTYVQEACRGLGAQSCFGTHSVGGGVVGAVLRGRAAAVVENYGDLPGARPELVEAIGRNGQAIGVPVWEGGMIAAVLLAARRAANSVTAADVECVEVLASYAGAALSETERQSERRLLNARLLHQAQHDELTALPNRPFFIEQLVAATARLSAPDAKGCLTLLFVDLDRFKHLNDGLGHPPATR